MGRNLSLGLSGIGVLLMVGGATLLESGNQMQVLAVAGGFVACAIGVTSLLMGSGGSYEAGTGAEEEKDKPLMVRILGIAVTLASLALPYMRLPLEVGADRTSYSFVSLVTALLEGVQVEITLLIFMSVVIAGAFASMLHHVGGYVVLFGGVGYGYIVSRVLDADPMYVVLNEFQPGLYVALIGALIIIASSFFKYEAAEGNAGVYGSGRL